MALSKQQSLSQYGTESYTGWGEAEAAADFKAKGGTPNTSSGGGGIDDILNNSINAISQYFPQKVQPYDEVNPFFFDEQLARKASTAEYSPYYTEMLTDYVSKVENTKSRSEQDMKRTLEQLEAGKEYYMGTQRRLLDKATKTLNEGYAGRGLFFSGARPKDIGELNKEYEAQTNNYLQNYQYQKTGAELQKSRTIEDTDLSQKLYTRDVEREKKAAIESGVLQRKGEVLDEYNAGMSKYYQNANYGGLA